MRCDELIARANVARLAAAGTARVRRPRCTAAALDRWALREEIGQSFARTDDLNLDRKQAMLGAFFAIEALAR